MHAEVMGCYSAYLLELVLECLPHLSYQLYSDILRSIGKVHAWFIVKIVILLLYYHNPGNLNRLNFKLVLPLICIDVFVDWLQSSTWVTMIESYVLHEIHAVLLDYDGRKGRTRIGTRHACRSDGLLQRLFARTCARMFATPVISVVFRHFAFNW